ncbi:MAG: aldehyde dehydrogenase family protein [Lentisphaerae bacterium]|nr:MAG: aldehyde dehydrogenase family protein [Lentisphaerota bacterium]
MLYPMFINGEKVSGSGTFDVLAPRTGEVCAKVAEVDAAKIDMALEAAQKGFERWSALPHIQRKAMLLRYVELLEANKERLVELLMLETGKTRAIAEYDFGMLPTCIRFYLEEMERLDQPVFHDGEGRFLHYALRQPLGVVVGFLAWNFPLLNLGYKLGPALAAGCSVIVKPSAETPLASLEAAYLLKEAGLPDGVVNVITASGHEITNRLLHSPVPAMVTMIGSTKAGREVMRESCSAIRHFSMELGGNAPVLVFDDADIEDAARKVVELKFSNCGQICVAPNRCFVHESVYEKFLDAAVSTLAQQEIAPLINAKARDRVLALVEKAVAEGATIVVGGHACAGPGFFMEGTILRDVTPQMEIAQTEIFGPVLPCLPFSDSDDPARLANDTPYGLAAYVFTRDLQRALRMARDIQAGSVCVNEPYYAVHLPHGGMKQSGIGRDCSRYSLEEYLTLKRVSICVENS